ncbi:SPOR domain-containing protein [Roseovarius nanhaiticus]|uniref:SPOR domain-containing protein n=1 Tax=Roseovarius nanhaiticus TaxID=573024 RepID=UPI002490CD20|nr:SPOR domain-containing protein [Roseovarius nanhaiticus]
MADFHAPEAPRAHSGHEGAGAYHNAQTAPRWDETSAQGSLGRATYALGSLVSVGLVIGLGVWGYQLLARDVSGVPVIRAATGPMRVQPEDPGGRQAQNQGLSVNAVAAVGTAGRAPDQLILAPAPLDLSEDDAPAPARRAEAAPTPAPEAAPEVVAETATEAVPEAAEASAPSDNDGTGAMLALAEALSDGVTPMTPLADAPTQMNEAIDAAVADVVEAADEPTNGIAASLRPKARPADLSNIRQVAAAAPASGGRDVDPDSIAVGTRLAQLGAFSSEDIAREEWSKLTSRFEEYLSGKDRVIQRATSGGRTFYRLRALGFEDLADARRFCSALVAEKAECIPVVTR